MTSRDDGIDTGPTLVDSSSDTAKSLSRGSLPGYQVTGVIGAGGMGEVVAAQQPEVGREVAVKRMRGAGDEAATTRFLREARIQARLEHPGIVPVYEIGYDTERQPYIAMRRLTGTTLNQLMRSEPRPTLQRLLRAFVEICRAVEFAHSRGVVHRDLKPANVVAGELGEIYVLDWGLARVVDSAVRESSIKIDTLPGETQANELLGTPGYMSPEQIRDAHSVEPPSDVYALGAILFELLARESLHPNGMAAISSTLDGINGSPARRRPDLDIPPELDVLCEAALAGRPSSRPTAHILGERVQAYLDGDRDVEQRRTLAAVHLDAAREALRTDPVGHRAKAASEAGRALALDPKSKEAAKLVNQLLLEVPPVLPDELRQELAESEFAAQRRQSRVGAASYGGVLAFMVIAAASGVTSWALWAAITGLAALLLTVALRYTRRAATPGGLFALALGNALLGALASRGFGSLILAPTLTCIMALSFASYPQLSRRSRLVIAILAASWLVPILLETLGVIPTTWVLEGNSIRARSEMFVLAGPSIYALLVGVHVAMIVINGLFARALAVSRHAALRESEIRAWHLRKLLSLGE